MSNGHQRWSKTLLWLTCLLPAAMVASCSSQEDSADDGEVKASVIPLKPGLWETRVTFTEIDVSSLGDKRKAELKETLAKGASSKKCLSAEEAKSPDADFFGGSHARDCKYKKFDVAGGNVDIGLSCEMEAMTIIDTEFQGSAAEKQFDLNMDMEVRLPIIGRVTLKGGAKGEYIGACSQDG